MRSLIEVDDRRTHRNDTRITVTDGRNKFCFERLTVGDVVNSPIEEVDNPVVYIGKDKGAIHYVDGKSLDSVPAEILNALTEAGYSVVTNVDGGWARWEGSPRLSTAYLDVSEAEVVASPNDDE